MVGGGASLIRELAKVSAGTAFTIATGVALLALVVAAVRVDRAFGAVLTSRAKLAELRADWEDRTDARLSALEAKVDD